ncbi:hypothetical protein A3C37_03220 [Candidatus Peribacteria bacterium RIFCSPHIGHO2_02_FULL_53_20]|nr:MAG: hypothetical protein A3C37_03220 [Candidatus Peribacteria bacterium RIFCSPHIGHO2_02_FULL_53_20]OGJ67417.1 MAG: hypothetical protein A3B61_00610 [Candidatus Peribacteria bacterium RIFCSPLOWO2_01_FULL_53_10]
MADNVEISPANKLLEFFCDKNHPTQELLDELRRITTTDRPGILTTVREGLQKLGAEQQTIADDNMKLLRERVDANEQEGAKDPEQLISEEEVLSLRSELDLLRDSLSKDPFAQEVKTKEESNETNTPLKPLEQSRAPYEESVPQTPAKQEQLQKKISAAPEKWFPQSADPREWTGKQIATLSAITLGGVGLYALWKWMRGEKKGGASDEKRSKWNWMLWVPFAGLTGYLGYKMWNKYGPGSKETADDKKRKDDRDYLPDALPDVIEKPAEAVIGGVEQGIDKLVETFGPAAYELMNHEHTSAVLKKRQSGEYKSDALFWAAMVGAMSLDGIDLVIDETACTLWIGGKVVECNIKGWSQLIEGFADGHIDLPEGCDLVATYIEGVFVYATSLYALKAVTLNRIGRGANVIGEAFGWPVYSITRGAKGTWRIAKGTVELGISNSPTRLVIAREADALRLETKLRLGTFSRRFAAATPEGLWMRKEFVADQANRLFLAKNRKVSEASIKQFEKAFGRAAEDFHTYLKRVPPDQLPDWFIKAVKARYPNIDPTKIELTHMEGLMRHLGEGSANVVDAAPDSADALNKVPTSATDTSAGSRLRQAAGGEVIEPKPETAKITSSASEKPAFNVVRRDGTVVDGSGKVIGEGDVAAQSAKAAERATGAIDEVTETAKGVAAAEVLSAADETRWKQLLSKFGEGAEAQNVRAFLEAASEQKLIKLDAEVFALINESPGAQKIITGAVQTGDVAEITRAMNAASAARNFRVGLNAVGAAGDLFGAYMAYCDYAANGARIETAMNSKNAALADLYRNANYIYGVEGTQSAAGLAIGGVAIVKAYVGGQSLLTALGASGGLIMLPVAAATLSGGFVYRKAEGVTETWLRTSKDWQKALSPGELLEKLKELGPGKRGYWQGWGKGTIVEQIMRAKTAGESGNIGAYQQWEEEGEQRIEKANESTRLEITKAYVVRTSLLAKQTEETDEQYTRRFDCFVMDQMEYIGRTTDGSFSYMLGDTYANARRYAEMLAKLRDEGKRPEEMPWKNASQAMDKQRAIIEYVPAERSQKILQFNLMQRMPTQLSPEQKKTVVKQDLILACQDDFLKLDGRIASTDFVGTGGTESVGEAQARYTASELFRERLSEQADQLLAEAAKPEGLTMISYQGIINKLGVVLETDPLELQRIGWKRRYVPDGRVTNLDATKNLLTAEYQLQSLQEEQKTAQTIAKEKTFLPEELQQECYDKGRLLLLERGGAQKGDKFQLQMGWIFNKYLYARFVDGQWQVGLNHAFIKWANPEGYAVTGMVNSLGGVDPSTAGKYNEVIRELAEINKRYGKSVARKEAA